MMIMMAPEASPEQIRQVVARLEATGTVHPKVVPGASQIAVPTFVSTLAICVVFVPVFFLTGVA